VLLGHRQDPLERERLSDERSVGALLRSRLFVLGHLKSEVHDQLVSAIIWISKKIGVML
jgi:hypothetical protein